MTIDPLDCPFHGASLRAYLEVLAESKQFPPDSETVRRRAYEIYEMDNRERKASKPPT